VKTQKWNDPILRNTWTGRSNPLAIVATGPSYSETDLHALDRFHVFAINAAITEHWRHPSVWWVVHDLFKIWRGPFEKKVTGWRSRRLITRKVYLPGRAGDCPYRAVGGGQIKKPFEWRLPPAQVAATEEYTWYTELPGQDGYMEPTETSVEAALDVATWWGFEPIVLVGVDLRPVEDQKYAEPWRWKRCAIRPRKFEAMRRQFKQRRSQWPEHVYHTSPYWKESPFQHVERLADVL
jgi:hypothetical protein